MKDKTEDLSSQDRHRSSSVLPVVFTVNEANFDVSLVKLKTEK